MLPITLRRFTELLFSILFTGDLAPGFPRCAALKGAATLDNNQNHQTKNSSRNFGQLFIHSRLGTVSLASGGKQGLISCGPLGIHKQQHDPTDERQHSDDWRNKVAVGGLNVLFRGTRQAFPAL